MIIGGNKVVPVIRDWVIPQTRYQEEKVLISLLAQSDLFDLIEKVEKGERLDEADGLRLLKSRDILALGYMANLIRERRHGKQAFFTLRTDTDTDAETKTDTDTNTLQTDTETIRTEGYSHFSRDAVLPYGEVRGAEARLERILKIREEQDRTGSFSAFMPLSDAFSDVFNKEETDEISGIGAATGLEDLKVLAVSRILLDNIPHIKTQGVMLGLKLTQVSLAFGVDYIDFFVGGGLTRQSVIRLIQAAGREAAEVSQRERQARGYC